MITVLRVMPSLSVKPFLARSLIIGAISTASILFGLVPNLQHPTSGFTLDFNTAAYAQSISDEEVISYARSVLAIEPFRQAAYEQIKQITGSSNVPQIACHRPSSLNELPSNIRQIAIDYCNQAISIVESNSLTISRFNEITVAHQSDSTLSERIQQIILQLQ